MRRIRVVLVGTVVLVAACSKGERSPDSVKTADSLAAISPAGAATTAATPAMTDANILAVLDAANAADSSAGSVAAQKGMSADVKAFGRDMVRDHHALRKQGEELAKKINVTPQRPAGDNSLAEAAAWHDSLNAMPKGPAFDKAYIDHEVRAHEQVLQKAQDAFAAAQNADLKAMIPKASALVQAHLDNAKKVQSKLGGAK